MGSWDGAASSLPPRWLSLPLCAAPLAADPMVLRLFLHPLFFLFPLFFPLCFPSFAVISPATGAPGSGVGRGLAMPPRYCPQPPSWGDPWLCRGGPSPQQRWTDRAIQLLVTPPVTNRPQLTRTDEGASQDDAGGKSRAGLGTQGGDVGDVLAVALGRWQGGTQVAKPGQPCARASIWGLGWGKFNKSYGSLLPELGLMGCQRRQGCLDLLIPWAWGTIHLALTLF